MLHVITVHYRSPAWIDIQRRYLDRFVSGPFEVWTSLQGIAPEYNSRFEHVFEHKGARNHAAKLNHLAAEACDAVDPDDVLVFLDGDAFPIATLDWAIERGLSRASLLAVQRRENLGDVQPHPSFCAVTAGEWIRLRGDWGAAATWPVSDIEEGTMTDTGGNLLRRLEATHSSWTPVHRSNGCDLHPLFYGIYGDLVYHHGAAFRAGLSRLDKVAAREARVPIPCEPLSRFVNHRLAGRRYRSRVREQTATSKLIYERIACGDTSWIDELRGSAPLTLGTQPENPRRFPFTGRRSMTRSTIP